MKGIKKKVVERFKRYTGLDVIEDIRLLNRYGATDFDELWTMILSGRTAQPAGWFDTKADHLIARVVGRSIEFKNGIAVLNRKTDEANAKKEYIDRIKNERYVRSMAAARVRTFIAKSS